MLFESGSICRCSARRRDLGDRLVGEHLVVAIRADDVGQVGAVIKDLLRNRLQLRVRGAFVDLADLRVAIQLLDG
jgi:hypothetical protein